jgi:dihydrofolate synthase / folylpolyglutamate synthase
MGAKAFKPTLTNSWKIMELLDSPQKKVKCIHVAGSNGKGSTCSMLASILTESGYKVGLFTSPHIKDFRERIRINGEQISEQNVIDFIYKIKQSPLDFEPSFFEITFGMAMEYFANENCDVCIIETGLGGRLDATNVVEPIMSIITNISLEHTAMLGNTLEEISFEKGGIIKPNIPVILGETEPQLYPIFKELASKNNSTIHYSSELEYPKNFNSPLLGNYQIENLRTVLKSCEVINACGFELNDELIQKGLDNLSRNTGFFGRLQVTSTSPITIFDVSHNPAGIFASMESIQKLNNGRLHIIYGTSADKDVLSILQLFPKDANYYFTEFSNDRSINIDLLKSYSEQIWKTNCKFFTDPNIALADAQLHANHEDTIVVIGSFFLISDFF